MTNTERDLDLTFALAAMREALAGRRAENNRDLIDLIEYRVERIVEDLRLPTRKGA